MPFEKIFEIRDETPHPAALNMAADEALLRAARAPLVRIYRWKNAAVSLGYFGKYAVVAAAWPRREIVRRMTGGGIVAHGADLTYSLIVPAGHPFAAQPPRKIYREVHETIAALVSTIGNAPVLAPIPTEQGTGVCFESAVEFDLISRGKKIAGAAMRRTRDGLLVQGSIQEIAGLESLRSRLAAAFANQVCRSDFSEAQHAEARALAAEKYATAAWTTRV